MIHRRRASTCAVSADLRRRIARLCPDWDAAAISGFVFQEGGYSNANYRFEYAGERYVLRAATATRGFVDREQERRIYASGSPALPEMVAFDTGSGDMICRWVPGALLADLAPDAATLADYLAKLHHNLPHLERIYDPVAQARAHLEAAAAPAWLETLAARTRWAPPRLEPCHNDLNPWNVIRTPEQRWVTLDWEWAGHNDPVFDLVNLHQGTRLADTALPEMAARYAGEDVAEARLEACITALWLRETTWALAEVAGGNDRPEIREQAETGMERLRARGS
ncbi:MAG: phosphotransferase [Pseudomonadota bacterium]